MLKRGSLEDQPGRVSYLSKLDGCELRLVPGEGVGMTLFNQQSDGLGKVPACRLVERRVATMVGLVDVCTVL